MADHVANLRALERWYRPSAGLSGLARAEIPQFAAEYAAALAYALRVIAAAEVCASAPTKENVAALVAALDLSAEETRLSADDWADDWDDMREPGGVRPRSSGTT